MEYDINVDSYGTKYYYKKGTRIYHREDGPAIEYGDGAKSWLINGQYHRTDGPALDYIAVKKWCVNALLHRTDGPAVEWKNGDKEWWINGFRLSAEKESVLNQWWDNKNGI